MNMPPDMVENRPSWLSQATVRILKLPRELPPRPGVEGLAIQLLRSIEADDIPVPSVCVTARGSIRILWEHHDRQLQICVTGPDSYRVARAQCGIPGPTRTVRRNRVDELRSLVAWLFPAANCMSADLYKLNFKGA